MTSSKKKKQDEIQEEPVQEKPEESNESHPSDEQTIETDRQADEARTVDIAAEHDGHV